MDRRVTESEPSEPDKMVGTKESEVRLEEGVNKQEQ
jgi:hypothetical protein